MSNQMQQALSNVTTRETPQSQRKSRATTLTPAATKRSGMDVVASALEALKASRSRSERQKADVADVAEQEKVAEQVAELYLGDAELTVELTQLNKERGHAPRGSVRSEEIRNEIDQKTALQGTVKKALEALKANPSAHTKGAQRYGRRQEAAQMASANREVSAAPENIRSRISGAMEASFTKELTSEEEDEYKRRGWATVSFDRKTYGSIKPEDPEADVTVSLTEMVSDLQSFRDEENQKTIAELVRGGFYISARREPDGKGSQLPSELDLLRDEPGTVRKASVFLSGNGQRYVAKVSRGFVVIENRDSKFVAVKTSDTRAGRALFTVPDRESGARVARKSAPEIANDSKFVTATDLSGVWYDPLRLALEEDIRRETESAERREVANELRDISDIENPLTLGDIATGGTGIAPVSVSYEDPENKFSRRHTVTFQVTGNGTTFSVTGTVPGTEETIKRVKRDRATRKVILSKPFLPEFVGKETSVAVLETDPMWREVVRPLNREFERNWQLAREAGQRNAVPVTAENLDGLTAIEGADGLYAVRATIRKNIADRGQEPKYRYNSVGYVVERKGSTIKIVWAVPGTSVAFANDLRGELEISNLPWRAKLILGNVFWTIRKTDAPEHLRLSKKQEATTDSEE